LGRNTRFNIANRTACKNAAIVAKPIKKEDVLRRTHPFTYQLALDCAYQCHVTAMTLSSTWRPMLGSVLHKLGDALDITQIDDADDELKAFVFNRAAVDSLADRFTRLVSKHPLAKPNATYYAYDHIEYADVNAAPDQQHTDHLHITANRFAKVQTTNLPPPTISGVSYVVASPDRQRFEIRGANFTPQSKVELVQFAQGGTSGTPITRNAFSVAEAGSIAWDAHFGDASCWQVTVMNPDGKRSNPMSFEVISPQSNNTSTMSTTPLTTSSIAIGNKY
jgi:hypothetical protein